jgi:hypothetical protein
MATLIRLKQIESGSSLQDAAAVGADFSQSVIDVVVGNIEVLLPTGVVSGSSQLTTSFDERYILSGSLANTTWDNIEGVPNGIISSSTQLDGTTLRNITIAPIDADSYSLIISGAVAIVDATNLSGGIDLDEDTTVSAQLWINNVNGATPPIDPSIGGNSQSNEIDLGEW